MRPLLQPKVEIMIATAMTYSPALPRIASSAAVATPSFGAGAGGPAGGLRPTVRPSRIRPASAAVLIAVSDVWMNAAVFTPRTLIQVSTAIEAMARIRCGESPTVIAPIGCGKTIVPPRNTSGESAGKSTAVERANAPATAAIVAVWVTPHSRQPVREPDSRGVPSPRFTDQP